MGVKEEKEEEEEEDWFWGEWEDGRNRKGFETCTASC